MAERTEVNVKTVRVWHDAENEARLTLGDLRAFTQKCSGIPFNTPIDFKVNTEGAVARLEITLVTDDLPQEAVPVVDVAE